MCIHVFYIVCISILQCISIPIVSLFPLYSICCPQLICSSSKTGFSPPLHPRGVARTALSTRLQIQNTLQEKYKYKAKYRNKYKYHLAANRMEKLCKSLIEAIKAIFPAEPRPLKDPLACLARRSYPSHPSIP